MSTPVLFNVLFFLLTLFFRILHRETSESRKATSLPEAPGVEPVGRNKKYFLYLSHRRYNEKCRYAKINVTKITRSRGCCDDDNTYHDIFLFLF